MPRRTWSLALSAAVILACFAALQAMAPPDGFFSGDQGAKYLQARAFALQGPLHPGIEVASRDVDPELRHQILENRGGRLVGVFSWLLPMLTAPFFAVFGMRGLTVVPALSIVALFAAAAALGDRLTGHGLRTAWIVVLAAPAGFYGAELWEHAPAAACVMVTALLLAPRSDRSAGRMLLAGAVTAAAGLFREEAFLALPALLVARAIVSPEGRGRDAVRDAALAAAGALAFFILTVPINEVVYGSPLPLHLTSEASKAQAHPPLRRDLYAQMLLPARFALPFAIAAILGVAASVRAGRSGGSRTWLGLTIAAVLTLLAIAIGVPLWRTLVLRESIDLTYSIDSIAHTWPFAIALVLLPMCAAGAAQGLTRYLCAAAALMVVGTIAIVPSTGGAQWSPRYLFAAAPLLAAAATLPALGRSTFPPRRAALVRWTAWTVLVASVLAQLHGLAYLIDAKARNARITRRLAEITAAGDVVISDVPWFPQVTAELAPSRRMLLARSPAVVTECAVLAAAHGIHHIAIVSSSFETGFTVPSQLDASSVGCAFTRTVRLSFDERGLILHRFVCETGATVLK